MNNKVKKLRFLPLNKLERLLRVVKEDATMENPVCFLGCDNNLIIETSGSYGWKSYSLDMQSGKIDIAD